MNKLTFWKVLFLVQILASLPILAQEGEFGDGLVEGPGLFSGEAGAFELLSRGDSKPVGATHRANLDADASISGLNEDEFLLFKKWMQAKQRNSAEYQEFQMWLKYLEFKRQTSVK